MVERRFRVFSSAVSDSICSWFGGLGDGEDFGEVWERKEVLRDAFALLLSCSASQIEKTQL